MNRRPLVRIVVLIVVAALVLPSLVRDARTLLALAGLFVPLFLVPSCFKYGGKTMSSGSRAIRSVGDAARHRLRERLGEPPPHEPFIDRLRDAVRRYWTDRW